MVVPTRYVLLEQEHTIWLLCFQQRALSLPSPLGIFGVAYVDCVLPKSPPPQLLRKRQDRFTSWDKAVCLRKLPHPPPSTLGRPGRCKPGIRYIYGPIPKTGQRSTVIKSKPGNDHIRTLASPRPAPAEISHLSLAVTPPPSAALTCVSGSPIRTLNSSTTGPSFVSMKPANSTPTNRFPSAAMAVTVAWQICAHSRARRGVRQGAGA